MGPFAGIYLYISVLQFLSHPSISIAPRHAIYKVSVFNQPVCTAVYRPARYCDNSAVRRYQARHPPQCIDCACVCICCPWTAPTRVHAPHAVIVTRSHMCRSEAGAAVPPRFITASHVCTLPWLPSLSISFPLPICSLFHLISLSFIFAYPFSSVSHPRLFRSSSLIYKHQCVCIYPSGIAIVE